MERGCLPYNPRLRGRHPLTHAGIYTPLQWTEFLTDACETITFSQLLLRAVIKITFELPVLGFFRSVTVNEFRTNLLQSNQI